PPSNSFMRVYLSPPSRWTFLKSSPEHLRPTSTPSHEAMAGWNACECLLDVRFPVIDAYQKAVLMIENSVITLTLCRHCESISAIELTL
ncbi:hypothetical protein, partial [Vibrio furnissii]|uniref:hypothetical protein n=1 Tax=Vibrio furnissii TaxID=29494 RepID=UPI001EEA855F